MKRLFFNQKNLEFAISLLFNILPSFNIPEQLVAMAKKQKTRAVDRENRSPMTKMRLNQSIKTAESLLSGDELESFRKLSSPEKRDVVLTVLKDAVDTKFIDYFRQLNSSDTSRSA